MDKFLYQPPDCYVPSIQICFGSFNFQYRIERFPLNQIKIPASDVYIEQIKSIRRLSNGALLALLFSADDCLTDFLNSLVFASYTEEFKVDFQCYLLLIIHRSLEEALARRKKYIETFEKDENAVVVKKLPPREIQLLYPWFMSAEEKEEIEQFMKQFGRVSNILEAKIPDDDETFVFNFHSYFNKINNDPTFPRFPLHGVDFNKKYE